MFKRFFQGSSAEARFWASANGLNGSHNGLSTPGNNERNQTDLPDTAKLSTFDEIYQRTAFKAATSTAAWNILKVADMVNNGHLQGLSPAAKHSAVMMALEAAEVSVEDMLQDAVQRQRVLNEYEDSLRKRLEDIQTAKHQEKERLGAEMDAMCAQYRMRIAGTGQEIERERALFREWQERKEKEHRRISEAASACAPSAGKLMLEQTSDRNGEISGGAPDDKSPLLLTRPAAAKSQPFADAHAPKELLPPTNALNTLATPLNGFEPPPLPLAVSPGADTPASKVPSSVTPPGHARRP
jgi:cell division septum initiation protein DivIVA